MEKISNLQPSFLRSLISETYKSHSLINPKHFKSLTLGVFNQLGTFAPPIPNFSLSNPFGGTTLKSFN